MKDKRRILIVIAIAVLFAVLVFSVIEAVYPKPEYEDFCGYEEYPKVVGNEDCNNVGYTQGQEENCDDLDGYLKPVYDEHGCVISYECDTCRGEFDQARDSYNQVVFYISALLALIAIFIGLYLPVEKNSLNETVGGGFMLGGIFALFFGTMMSFSSLGRFVKPVIIFIELALVIFIAYKKFGKQK